MQSIYKLSDLFSTRCHASDQRERGNPILSWRAIMRERDDKVGDYRVASPRMTIQLLTLTINPLRMGKQQPISSYLRILDFDPQPELSFYAMGSIGSELFRKEYRGARKSKSLSLKERSYPLFCYRRVLVVGTHPDDETIACGGLMARAKRAGAEVFVATFVTGNARQYGGSSKHETREAEYISAMESLGVDDYEIVLSDDKHLLMDTLPQKKLIDLLETESRLSIGRVRPDLIVTPGPAYNQDHKALHEACIAALRSYPRHMKHSPTAVLSYSHFDEQTWNSQGIFALGRLYIDITPVIGRKRKALECYDSQMKKNPLHWRTVENIIHVNRTIGMRIGVAYAEEFICLRMQI